MTQLRRRPEVDYYKELQIDADAEPEVIEAAYRALSKKYHPDINHAPDSEDRMARINSAYNTLSDASKRRDYNHLRLTPPPTSTVPHSRNPASAASRAHTVKTAPAASPSVRKTSPPDRPDNPRPTSSTFSPSPGGQNSPKSTGQAASSSFRPQNSPPQNSAAGPGVNRTVPSYTDEPRQPRSRRWLWLVGICVTSLALLVGGVLGVETLFGNPLKTSFLIKQPAVVVIPAAPTPTRAPAGPAATSQPVTIPPTVTASRESVNAFLSNAELYAGRVSDVGLTAPDVLQLRVKLAANGIVLNSESPLPGRTADELDVLRQSEATTYNLIYTLFGRFQELNRINLILTDLQDKAVYRADVARSAAFTFYSWHSSFNYNDPAEAAKAARQDRLSMHFGVLLDESLRLRLQTPSESNLQAELQSIGLTAFAVTGGSPPSVNYAQVRSQAEIAVDFARIIYTLYTRFPALDKLQIVLFSSPDRPVKVTDRQLFNQITLESWSQAGYGGAAAGGDRQAQTFVAALPGNFNEIKQLPPPAQVKFKTAAQVGNWAVVAESVERLESLTLEGQRFTAGKDRQFLMVKVALRNFSDGRAWLLPGEKMSLVDLRNQGQVYISDPSATLLYVLKTPASAEPPPGPIGAGKQSAVYVAFNVPTNINLSTLRLQFQDSDKHAQLELS